MGGLHCVSNTTFEGKVFPLDKGLVVVPKLGRVDDAIVHSIQGDPS